MSGTSFAGTGVNGTSTFGPGVTGTSDDGAGVTGTSTNNFGVVGSSQIAAGVRGSTTNEAQSGVLGIDECVSPAAGVGVSGMSTQGTGVNGNSTSGPGVAGSSTSGTGVQASSTSGIALDVHGKARFSSSGVAAVPQGQRSVTVTVAGVTTSNLVLATMQTNGAAGARPGGLGRGCCTWERLVHHLPERASPPGSAGGLASARATWQLAPRRANLARRVEDAH